jgi:hypothetical protein
VSTKTQVDPEIEQTVASLRDRFGAAGLDAAAQLIEEERERTRAVIAGGLADAEQQRPGG